MGFLSDDELREMLSTPQSVAVDGMSVTMPSIRDVAKTLDDENAKSALAGRKLPIRYGRFIPPGAVGPNDR
jgi:hypothetical protein